MLTLILLIIIFILIVVIIDAYINLSDKKKTLKLGRMLIKNLETRISELEAKIILGNAIIYGRDEKLKDLLNCSTKE